MPYQVLCFCVKQKIYVNFSKHTFSWKKKFCRASWDTPWNLKNWWWDDTITPYFHILLIFSSFVQNYTCFVVGLLAINIYFILFWLAIFARKSISIHYRWVYWYFCPAYQICWHNDKSCLSVFRIARPSFALSCFKCSLLWLLSPMHQNWWFLAQFCKNGVAFSNLKFKKTFKKLF